MSQTKSSPFRKHACLALILICAIFAFASTAQAEYRVFRLQIQDTKTGSVNTVTTTLDNLQWHTYHNVKSTDKVTILATWMCWIRSDISQDPAQRYCPNPREVATAPPARAPASLK